MTPKEKWKRRAAKLRKKKTGMQVRGRSIFTLQEIARRKAQEARQQAKKERHEPQD